MIFVGIPSPSLQIQIRQNAAEPGEEAGCIILPHLSLCDTKYLGSNTPPQAEVCIRGHSVPDGYYKLPENYIIEVFDRSFPIHISPEIVAFNYVGHVAHIPASATQSEITQEFTTMMFHHRQNQNWGYDDSLMNERRSASMPSSLLVLLPPINSVSKRTQCRSTRFLRHH